MSEAKPASRRSRILRVFLALVVVAFGGWILWDSQRGWTAARLERLIRSEVRPGCDRATVEAFLDRHGIERVWDEEPTNVAQCASYYPEVLHLHGPAPSSYCLGIITGPKANVGLLASGEVLVYFFFDRRGHLLVHTVRAYVEGL